MTTEIIITICILLLLAYVFDISSVITKIPSVILLLALGFLVKITVEFFDIAIPSLSSLLPALGTIGLILIVLEGALELEINKSKLNIISKSFIMAVLPIVILSFLISFAFQYYFNCSLKIAMINAIPLCVISSAIAIPSVRNLDVFNKEFVVYESSFSDIIGVLYFNFLAVNEHIDILSFRNFGLELIAIIIISFVAVLGLSFLLSRITHHITYTPIILLTILIYEVSKIYHLPGLIFILVFGLVLGNLDELKRFKWIERFRPEKLDKEVVKFKEITIEVCFLIRALFFMLFGFLMDITEIFNLETLPWAVAITATIFAIRLILLKVLKLSIPNLLYVAPRGLITILLFLAIVPERNIYIVNKSLVIQTILLTVLIMMFGLILNKKREPEIIEELDIAVE